VGLPVTHGSYTTPRVLAGLAALPLTALALMTIGTAYRGQFDPIGGILGACSSAIAILCWWFALRGEFPESRARILAAVMGGFILGAIGFAAGFLGPLILKPDANQGPLLGIFVTGPLGFVLGALVGWLYSRYRVRGERPTEFAKR